MLLLLISGVRDIVTAIPPTQGRGKITVRVGNITRRVNSLAIFNVHKVIQHLIVSHAYTATIRHQQTLTLSGSLND